jgi:hypothetical protein
VFTPPQEQLLATIVDQASPAMSHTQMQGAAQQLFRAIEIERHGAHHRRSIVQFRASDGFVSGFKRRQRLSSHRMSVRQVRVHEDTTRNVEHEILEFVNDVRVAVTTYGAVRVLNMDETPVPKCEHPITGVVRTGSPRAAECKSNAGNKLNVTHFPTITASGGKLQMCAIIKGKTPRSLTKITMLRFCEQSSHHTKSTKTGRLQDECSTQEE